MTPSGATPASQAVFEGQVYDFGYAGPELDITHIFKFTNTGSTPILVNQVTTDCGCTAETVSTKPIAPDGQGGILAECKTMRHEGKQKRNITVSFNNPEMPDTILTIKGTIKRGIVVRPQGISFGHVKKGDASSRQVRLFQLSKNRLILNKVEADERYYTIRTSRFDEENSRGFDIDVTLKPDVPAGKLNDVITLHTNVKKRPRIDVMIWADVKE